MKPANLAARLLACSLPLLPVVGLVVRPAPIWAQPLPERRPLSGRITRGDGAGVARATVTIQRENDIGSFAFWGAQTATDASGFFSFPEAEEGSYFISIEADGYAPLQNKPLRIDDNSAIFNTRLDKLATLSLRLLRPDGTPLVKSRIVVRLSRADASSEPVRRQTDASGLLQISDQSPGAYSLEVAAPGAGFAPMRAVAVKYLEVPEPIDVRLQSGGALKITARDANEPTRFLGGATLSLSATLEPSEDERKSGRLSPRSLAGLQSLYAYSSDGSGAVTREGDGTLELRDLPPGRYRAKLVLPAYAPSETREVQVKAGGSSTAEFDLSAQVRSSSLKVRVVGKDSQPLANRDWVLQLRSLGPLGGADLAAPLGGEMVIDMGGFGVLVRRARSDEKGEMTLFPIRSGRWRVLAFAAREDGERTARAATAQRDVEVPEEGGETTLRFENEAK